MKLKSILLRCLHGDVYCNERMKRIGMTDNDMCIRCSKTETIKHLILECDYTKTLWGYVSKLTGIQLDSIDKSLGIDPKHDRVTLTLHAETIRRLLSIDRPTVDPKLLLKSIITNLYVLEKGVTKYQVGAFLESFKQ